MASSPKAEPRNDSSQTIMQTSTEQTNLSTCGVCNEAPPKYKCPKCYLPYCSVACNKIHRETHPPEAEPAPEPKTESPPTAVGTKLPTITTPTARDPNNPFSALDAATDKLHMLFSKYPNLPQQLAVIDAAMQPPDETQQNGSIPASLLKGLPKQKGGWNHDVGIKNGRAALKKARKAAGRDGEAVKEYCELIRYLMNGRDGEDATALLQEQAATQDTELIERLMAEEKRR